MRLALATGIDIPDESALDDEPLQAELVSRGIDYDIVPWETESGWDAFDAVLIRTTWDYMSQRARFLDWARSVDATTPLFNPPDLVEWNTDKRYLGDLQRSGAPLAPIVWIEQRGHLDVAATIRRLGWRRAFLKPVVGANASDTLRFDSDPSGIEAAQSFLDERLADEGFMLQPYLSNIETKGEISAICFDGEISHAVNKTPPTGDYRVQDDWGASDRRIELEAYELTAVASVLRAVQDRGPGLAGRAPLYARVDMQWDDDERLCLTEVEMVEPSLFFRHDDRAATRFVEALLNRL